MDCVENVITHEDRLSDQNWSSIITRVQCPCGTHGISKEVEYNNSEQTSIVSYNFDCPKCKHDYAVGSELFYDSSSVKLELRHYLVSTKNKSRRRRLHFKPILVPYLNRYY